MERKNPLKEIYGTIDHGTAKEKMLSLPEFPKIIEFELTNHCNYKCIMCPTGLNTAKRSRGYMKEEIYHKILGEMKNYKTAVKFVGQGEPFMHPNAMSYIEQMKKTGILVHITTNGSFLTEDMMRRLVEIEVDSIKFSFQGVNADGYQLFRQKNVFEEYLACIRRFSEIRGTSAFPFLTIGTSVIDESKQEIQCFKERCEQYVDKVEVGITSLEYVDFSHIKDEEKRKKFDDLKSKQKKYYKRYQVCPQIFDTIAIRWNGDITACCSDMDGEMTLGNVESQSILECWTGSKENFYRKILADGEYEKIPHCSKCYDIYGWTYGTN